MRVQSVSGLGWADPKMGESPLDLAGREPRVDEQYPARIAHGQRVPPTAGGKDGKFHWGKLAAGCGGVQQIRIFGDRLGALTRLTHPPTRLIMLP